MKESYILGVCGLFVFRSRFGGSGMQSWPKHTHTQCLKAMCQPCVLPPRHWKKKGGLPPFFFQCGGWEDKRKRKLGATLGSPLLHYTVYIRSTADTGNSLLPPTKPQERNKKSPPPNNNLSDQEVVLQPHTQSTTLTWG